jgi:hypothetical protein
MGIECKLVALYHVALDSKTSSRDSLHYFISETQVGQWFEVVGYTGLLHH